MARLPRRTPVSTPAPQAGADAARPIDHGDGRAASRGTSAGFESPAGAAGAVGERGPRGGGAAPDDGVGLDAAIDGLLVAGGVDAITRVRLSEARRAIVEAGPAQDADGLEGPSLSRSLFRFVMPRLRHPDVLRADRHRALLEGLADGLADAADDGIAREGALVLHRELRRLAMLRTARNALVGD
jgi:hypothetical protein